MSLKSIENQIPIKPVEQNKSVSQGKIAKLKKASEQFEAILIGKMMQAMRQTVPKGGLLEQGLEMDIFNNLFDEKIANKTASRHQLGFAEIIFKQMAGKLNLGQSIDEIFDQINKVKSESKEWVPSQQMKIGRSQPQSSIDLNSFQPIIEKAADKYNIDSKLIEAVIRQESAGDPNAVSNKGAKGLMQLMDSTAQMLGVEDPFNPYQNIMAGARYLKNLLTQFDNNIELALASYNAGPTNVKQYGGIPPFEETKQYVKKVINNYQQLKSI